jgi:hypothetical protein
VLEKWRLKVALGDDHQPTELRIKQLNSAEIGALHIDRGVEHLLENRCRITGCDQVGAELVQLVQRAQLCKQVVLQGGGLRIWIRRSCACLRWARLARGRRMRALQERDTCLDCSYAQQYLLHIARKGVASCTSD